MRASTSPTGPGCPWEPTPKFYDVNNGAFDDAERCLTDLVRRSPEDGAAFHNLGAISAQRGDFEQAVELFRQSLAVRPDSPSTLAQLDQAVAAAGHTAQPSTR